MRLSNPAAKDDLRRRLRRIEGQVRGIEKMMDEDRDCREIIQQLASIRSAVQAASLVFMRETVSDCLLSPENDTPEERRRLVNDLVELIGKAP
ncbi:MAG TPA: metal-sensitive transcriptional regulator [Anaerolineaceae bacterium]|nr:metal-sensitive transcriptional regulator [Anaerolineaceae bacterium]